ncbi:MAG: hypothetical protein IKU94_02295 [Bacteroidaceae bacterium]|nr:hypothetical protein [Bacteroidaceae bacterium]
MRKNTHLSDEPFFVKNEYKLLIKILVFNKNKVILPSKITSLPKRCAQKATFQTRIGHRKQPMYYVGYMQQRGASIITEQKYKEAIQRHKALIASSDE